MPSIAIPATIEDVTPKWLSQALGEPVDRLEIADIGSGVGLASTVYRASIDGDRSVIVKLIATEETAHFTSSMLRMYAREVLFYRELADICPVKVPSCSYSDLNEAEDGFVLIIEDMGDLRPGDQVGTMPTADVEAAIDGLAAWHSHWWRDADRFAGSGAAVPINGPIYPAVLPVVFGPGLEKLSTELVLDPAVLQIGSRWEPSLLEMLDGLHSGPTTLLHGDWRGDNMMFDPDGALAMVDFQLTGVGTAAYDLAYFVTQSIEPEQASQNERAWFDRWTNGLVSAGIPEADIETLWDQYRLAAAFCLVYPVVSCGNVDMSNERERALVTKMIDRFTRAANELDLLDVLSTS